uniref:Putative membrane protein n=1 Tax=Jingmen tick virus TaxID=1172985 RepID=A0A7D0QV68_9FLAV|nr:putative membrane protein [Jingmen tick virus]
MRPGLPGFSVEGGHAQPVPPRSRKTTPTGREGWIPSWMTIAGDYFKRLQGKADIMGEGLDIILDEARDLFPSSKEFALPGLIRQYLERRDVPLDSAFFLDVFLPLVLMALAITTNRWTRMALAVGVYLTGYYYAAIMLAATSVVSLAFKAFAPRKYERGEVVIENGRLSVLGITAVAVAATVGIHYCQPSPALIFAVASLAGFAAILMALPTIQYHGATDVAKMMMAVLLFAGVIYIASSFDVDKDQLYLFVKTGTPTYHIPRGERENAVKMDQVYNLARYYARYPADLRARFVTEEAIWEWDPGATWTVAEVDYMATILHAVIFSLAVYTMLTDSGETDRVLGDIKMRILEKIKTTELFGDVTMAKITLAVSRVEWLAVIAGNLLHTYFALGLPGVAVEVLLAAGLMVPTYHLWSRTYRVMSYLRGTNGYRQPAEGLLPAPTIRNTQTQYTAGLATIVGTAAVLVNLYYYLIGSNPYYVAHSVLVFAGTFVMVQDNDQLNGYPLLMLMAYTFNSPSLALIGSIYKKCLGRVLWSRTT